MHDFSPKGRHEVKDCLDKLSQASGLQQLIGANFSIEEEFNSCTSAIKEVEAKEQDREASELENAFSFAIVNYRLAMTELVSFLYFYTVGCITCLNDSDVDACLSHMFE
jgi:hypothetical protein